MDYTKIEQSTLLVNYCNNQCNPCDDANAHAVHEQDYARSLLRRRRDFGITRVGSLTRLGSANIAVVQAVRPLARSNAVNQGKGLDLEQATISALMEALEMWAGENLPPARIHFSTARKLGGNIRDLYASCLVHSFDAGWDQLNHQWINGWDLISLSCLPVPMALVDTIYTLPSPHPVAFPRTTTGLGAGRSFVDAVLHAGLEILERHCVSLASRSMAFADTHRVDPDIVAGDLSREVLARLRAAGLDIVSWFVPTSSGFPAFWCNVFERDDYSELAPLPAQGFGCDFTHDAALAKALLEAGQARVVAIAGGREDITRNHYPGAFDRKELLEWKRAVRSPSSFLGLATQPTQQSSTKASSHELLNKLVIALREEGARAIIVVPLFACNDPPIAVVRLAAPPLRVSFHA
jgi:ribosomal protein S12 methylthiotransferase accessory factor